jgi:signal transduction histidine kinase
MIDVLTTSFAVVRSFAQSKQICLEMVVEEHSMVQQMNGDPNRMTLVLINFLANSIKRSQPNGKIIVQLKVVKNFESMEIGALLNAFQISIEDFGPIID